MVAAFVTAPAPHRHLAPPTTHATAQRAARRRRFLAAAAAGGLALAVGAGLLALAPTGEPGQAPAVVPSPPASAEYLARTIALHP